MAHGPDTEPSLYSAHGQVRERGTQCLVHLARPRLCALRLLVVKVVTSECQQEMSSGPHWCQQSQYYSRATQQSIQETQRIIANCEYCHRAGKMSILDGMRCAQMVRVISHGFWHPVIRILSVSKNFEQNWYLCPGQDKVTETEEKMLIYILQNFPWRKDRKDGSPYNLHRWGRTKCKPKMFTKLQ